MPPVVAGGIVWTYGGIHGPLTAGSSGPTQGPHGSLEPVTDQPTPSAPKATAMVERRFLVAAGIIGFGIGITIGLRLAGGMEPIVKTVEIPVAVRVPCKDCEHKEQMARESRVAPIEDATIPAVGESELPATFSPLATNGSTPDDVSADAG